MRNLNEKFKTLTYLFWMNEDWMGFQKKNKCDKFIEAILLLFGPPKKKKKKEKHVMWLNPL